MNDLIKELREWAKSCALNMSEHSRNNFDEILSRHEAEQGEGLRRKLVDILTGENCPCWRRDCKNCVTDNCSFVSENIDKIMQLSIPTPDKAVEPLAVLADRKGYPKTRTYSGSAWAVYIWGITDMVFEAPTYAAAEAKAREYLNGLPDKK